MSNMGCKDNLLDSRNLTLIFNRMAIIYLSLELLKSGTDIATYFVVRDAVNFEQRFSVSE